MSRIGRGVCWALAMLLVALSQRIGLVSAESAGVLLLLLLLPVVAVLSLAGRGAACGCVGHASGRERRA